MLGVWGWALSNARPPALRACGRGPLPTGCGCGVRAWGPGCPWHLLPSRGPPCAVCACRVLCALPGFAASVGCCGLAPVLVPWLWPAACLSGVSRGPALVRRASSGPVALGAPVGFPVAVVPSPIQGAVTPGFTGWLRGARRGRPRNGLIVPAAGPCRGKGAGHAPRRTRSGPRDGVVPGWSLRVQSWAACAALVWRVWNRSLTHPVSRTVRSSMGDSAGAPGLFRVGADTAPFNVGGRHARVPGVCVCPCSSWLGRVGRPPGRVLVRLTFPVAVLSFFFVRPPRAGVARASGVFCFRCSFLFLLTSPLASPLFPAFCASRPWVPWALALFIASYPPDPPPFFSFLVLFCCPAFLPLCAPLTPFLVFAPLPSPPAPFSCVFCVLFFFSFFPHHPPCAPLCCCFWCPGASALWGCPRPPFLPPPFFPPFVFAPCQPLSCLGFSVVSGPGCPGPQRFVSAYPNRHLSFSLFFCCGFAFPLFPGSRRSWCSWPLLRLAGFLLPPPCAALRVVCTLRAGAVPPPLAAARVLLCLVSCCVVPRFVVGCFVWLVAFCGVFRCLMVLVLCCVVCCCAVLCSVLSCVVPSRVVVWCVVLSVVLVRGVLWSSGPPRCVGFSCPPPPLLLLPPVAVAWSLVLARCCVLSWLRCCVGLFCRLLCDVLPSALFPAGAALLLRSRWLVLCVVACGCWVFAAGSGCPLFFSARVLWRGRSCLTAWPAALLCALVCCGVPLPCAVSCVLWRSVAVCCRAVVPCRPFCFVLWSARRCVAPWRRLWCAVLFFVVLCSVPPSCRSVPCSAAVWALFCAWCRCPCLLVGLVACFCFLVARVGPGVLVWPLAARPAVWCAGAVSCTLCCVLWCCAALWCCAVWLCCALVRAAGFSFSFSLSSFPLQKWPAVSPLL